MLDIVIMYITWPVGFSSAKGHTHLNIFFFGLCIIYSEYFVYAAHKFNNAVVYELSDFVFVWNVEPFFFNTLQFTVLH